jgi:hypothetical protein
MAEYLGYINPADAKANPTLDWGTVISDVQDTIVNQEKQRQANREKAAKDSAELAKELNNISLSRSQDINDFLTNSVYKAKDLNLEAHKLYTSGKINGKQLNIIQSNLKNGFNEFDALGKNISKIQEEYAKLSEQGKASFLADYNMNQLGNSLDLKNKVPYVDPATGLMYVAPLGANGSPDLSKLDSPRWMLSQADMPLKFDYQAEADKYSKDLGKFEYILQKPPAGGIWTADNIKESKGFNDWLEETSSAIASNTIRQASILGDRADSDYKTTSDPNSKDKNSIIMKKDYTTGVNTPVLTKEQIEESKTIVKNAILAKVNSTLKQQENTYRPPSGGSGGDKEPKYTSIQPTVDAGGNVIIPMSGVNVKTGSITENISDWGRVANSGKLFINYNYPVDVKDAGNNVTRTIQSKQVYEGSPEFNRRLGQLINPSTGKKVRSLDEAMRYVNSISGGGNSSKNNSEYTNLTETNKGTLGLKNGKWYNIKTGKIAQ